MRIVFDQKGTFQASWAAERWCKDNGISVGSSQAMAPRGLLRGDFTISKWRNMSRAEIAALDGTMSGDMREGPVIIELREPVPNACGEPGLTEPGKD